MVVRIRVVLDQLVAPTAPELELVSRETARALVRTAPAGCEVEAILPAGEHIVTHIVPGLGPVRASILGRRELIAAWQLGVAPTLGGGMIHAPTLAAPLIRHDRANDHDQTVVTIWDLQAWEVPHQLARGAVAWQKGMLRRAEKFADAVVVPTFALAAALEDMSRLGDRIRVIPGAASAGFQVPTDASARVRDLQLPPHFLAISGTLDGSDALSAALHAASAGVTDDRHVVVFGARVGEEPGIAELASSAGIPERHVHVRGELDDADRAAVLDAADLYLTAATGSTWPWRLLEALALGVPVVASDTPTHREVLAEGGLLADDDALGEAVTQALDTERRAHLRVLSSDRGRGYSWDDAADRIWQLHAEL